jgi:hypothetical protein
VADDFSGNDIGAPIQSCPEPESSHWLEIEMLDEDDQPAQFIEYRVTTPGGENIKGYLDDSGWARLSGLKQGGQYQIAFPELDMEAWDYIGAAGARSDGKDS